MPDFDALIDTLKNEVVDLAESHLQEATDAAIQDGEEFLHRSEENLKRWTRLLEQEKLSQEEFELLVRGQKDLAEMEALKRAGLAAARIDQFREALLDRVIHTASRVVL